LRSLSVITVAALLTSFALCAEVQTNDLGVIVVEIRDSAENVPISNAYVLLHNNFGARDPIIRRIGPGQFEISVAPGLYDVFSGAKGFAPRCSVAKVGPGGHLRLQMALKVDEEHMEQSSRQ
jgi:hypothetical protein